MGWHCRCVCFREDFEGVIWGSGREMKREEKGLSWYGNRMVAWDILIRECLLARDVGVYVYADLLCLNTSGYKHESRERD